MATAKVREEIKVIKCREILRSNNYVKPFETFEKERNHFAQPLTVSMNFSCILPIYYAATIFIIPSKDLTTISFPCFTHWKYVST